MSRRINPTDTEGLDGDLFSLIKADVRGHLRSNTATWHSLSEETGVGWQTIANFAYGLTLSPRMRTIVALMEGMGRGDELRQAFHCDKPVTTEEALRTAPPGIKKKYENRKKAIASKKGSKGKK